MGNGIMDKAIFYKNWHQSGINHVNQIIKLWRKQGADLATNTEQQETFATSILKSNKPNRLAYEILIEAKTDSPIPSQLKWCNATQEDHDFDWHTAYHIALKCTKSTKLIKFLAPNLTNKHSPGKNGF